MWKRLSAVSCPWKPPQTALKKILAIVTGTTVVAGTCGLGTLAWYYRPQRIKKAMSGNKIYETGTEAIAHIFLWGMAGSCCYVCYDGWKTLGTARNFCHASALGASMTGVMVLAGVCLFLSKLMLDQGFYQKGEIKHAKKFP